MGTNSITRKIIRGTGRGSIGVLLVLIATLASAQAPQPEQSSPVAVAASAPLLRLDGAIGPASADFIARGLHKAAAEGAPLLILQIDTPGGLDSSTRQIVKDILASPVPVIA